MNSVVVLSVEDDPLVALTVREGLREAGYEVCEANSGNDAVSFLDTSHNSMQALVTDVRLGSGPSGWDIARHARQLQPALPVVYVSGDSQDSWAAEGVAGSVFIAKPFAIAQLTTAVSALLNKPGIPASV